MLFASVGIPTSLMLGSLLNVSMVKQRDPNRLESVQYVAKHDPYVTSFLQPRIVNTMLTIVPHVSDCGSRPV